MTISGRAPARAHISMNGNMNGDSQLHNRDSQHPLHFQKYTEIIQPPPAQAFVFLDEHADGIDDGYFLVFVNRKQLWAYAGQLHNGACGFSFADGHAEIRKWMDPDSLAKRSSPAQARAMCRGSGSNFVYQRRHGLAALISGGTSTTATIEIRLVASRWSAGDGP